MVAHQPPVGGVVGQLHRAPGALGHLAALPAGDHAAGPPAVEKQNGLLPPHQVVLQLPAESGADGPGVALAQFLFQVHQDDLRQGFLIEALPQLKQGYLPGPGLVHGLQRRGGRAQHQQGVVLDAAVFGHIPGVVPGDVFRLVAALLLLVQNDETQVGQGGEHRRAGADYHVGISPPGPLPLVIPLPRPQGAVEDGHPFSKV